MSKTMTFEEALKRLEEIVDELENGDIPLDKSIKTFEEGSKLVDFCLSKLDSAEKKIKKLVKDDNGNLTVEDFD
jgi:exodeoxyribonuclease VII small subunit